METFFLVLHVVLCFVVVIVILLQSGQGGGLGAGFNNAAALGQEVFGGRGAAGFLVKVTVVAGTSFMITSMVLAWYSSKPQSALDLEQEAEDPVNAVTHQIVYEGGSEPEGAGPQGAGAGEQQLEIGGEGDGEVDLQELLGGEGEDSNLDVQFDEDGGGEIPEEAREQLEGLQQGADSEMDSESPASQSGDESAQPEIDDTATPDSDGDQAPEADETVAPEPEETTSPESEETTNPAPAEPSGAESDGESPADSETDEPSESQSEGDGE